MKVDRDECLIVKEKISSLSKIKTNLWTTHYDDNIVEPMAKVRL